MIKLNTLRWNNCWY